VYKAGITKLRFATRTRHMTEFLTGREQRNNQTDIFLFSII